MVSEKLTRIMSAACDRTRAGKDHVKVQVADWHALMALADEAKATTRAPADLRSALEAETIERKALHEILRVRPPGDVETCKVPRKLVEQMERIAMAALAPTKEPAA
jgi:hypothetical protein